MHLYLTPISLVYIISGLIGLCVSSFALPHYLFTYRKGLGVRDEVLRGKAKLVNSGVLITEGLRFSIHLLTAAVGVQSLFIGPSAPVTAASTFHQIFGFEVITVLLWASIGTTINSVVVWMQYRLLRVQPRTNEPIRGKAARHAFATLKWQMRGLVRAQRHTDERAEVALERADHAETRADIAEGRADDAHARADVVDVQQVTQDSRIEVSETTITQIKRVVDEDGSA